MVLPKNSLSIFLFIFAFFVFPANAQNTEEEIDSRKAKGTRAVYWAEAGFGFSTQAWTSQINVNLELFNNIVLTAGYENSDRGDVKPMRSFFEHSGFYGGLGLVNKKGMSLKMVSISLASMDYSTFNLTGQSPEGIAIHSKTTQEALGVRLEGKIIPNNGWVGLSFSPFVNINKVNTFVGASVSLALGRMW